MAHRQPVLTSISVREACSNIVKSILGKVDNAVFADALDFQQLDLDSLDLVDIQSNLEDYFDISLNRHNLLEEGSITLDYLIDKVNEQLVKGSYRFVTQVLEHEQDKS